MSPTRGVRDPRVWLLGVAVADCLADGLLGGADVLEGPTAEAVVPAVVLALLDVGGCPVQQLAGVAQPIAVVKADVDRRVILERLAIVDRRPLDLADRGVDLTDRGVLVPLHLGRGWALEQRAGEPHVGQRVQVRGVVATAVVRAQYGSRLASVYAPAVIASFGSGNARIDIREVFPGGTKRYRQVQQPDMRTRQAHDALLLTNSQITFSATARKQLLSGDIDPRLPQLLAYMAHGHHLTVADFGDQSPGGGPASLLRSVDLTTAGPAAHTTSGAYPRWMQRFFRVQRAQYHLAWSHLIRSATGQPVLNIGYDAPSPLS